MRKCNSYNLPSTIISIQKHQRLNLLPLDKSHPVNILFRKNKTMATNKMGKIPTDLINKPIVLNNLRIEFKNNLSELLGQ